MSDTDTVESYLIQSDIQYEPVDDSTWILQLDNERASRVVLKVQSPILLFSTPILDIDDSTPNTEALYQTLLELNAELIHASYGLQNGKVILSGAQQLVSVDLVEFQATIDDIAMALDTHLDKLSDWSPKTLQGKGQ